MEKPVRLCFVCLGNICRSPTAAAIMRRLVSEAGLDVMVHVESAGTGDWHLGERADPRAVAEASRRGIDLHHRARQFVAADFDRFDCILAMDTANHEELLRLAPDASAQAKVRYLREFDPAGGPPLDVPDPYCGGQRGFADVFDLCETACRGLLNHIVSSP